MALRKPELRKQQIFLPELISERVEQGPRAARFFLYLAGRPPVQAKDFDEAV